MTRVVLFTEINSRLGAPFLNVLSDRPDVELVAVVTSPPDRTCSYFAGESDQVDVERMAATRGVPVLRPSDVNHPSVGAELAALRPDWFVVGNYQRILTPDVLAVPRVAAVNFHPSPLPRYAGLAPFFWMAKAGEQHSGVTALVVTPGIDDGPVIRQRTIPLRGDETALEIRESHIVENVDMLREVIPDLVAGTYTLTDQDQAERTYFGRPQESDRVLDFEETTSSVLATVRAGYRRPGAVAYTDRGDAVTVLTAEPAASAFDGPGVLVPTADGSIRIATVEQNGHEVGAASHRGARALGSPAALSGRATRAHSSSNRSTA